MQTLRNVCDYSPLHHRTGCIKCASGGIENSTLWFVQYHFLLLPPPSEFSLAPPGWWSASMADVPWVKSWSWRQTWLKIPTSWTTRHPRNKPWFVHILTMQDYSCNRELLLWILMKNLEKSQIPSSSCFFFFFLFVALSSLQNIVTGLPPFSSPLLFRSSRRSAPLWLWKPAVANYGETKKRTRMGSPAERCSCKNTKVMITQIQAVLSSSPPRLSSAALSL